MSITYAAFGWKIKRHEEWREEETEKTTKSD
jgi:hypothetical protein